MNTDEDMYVFIKANGFKLVDAATSEYFGDYYDTFANNDFELRFISDKSFKSIDIKNIEEQGCWYDLALVKALLYPERNLNHVTTANEYNDFLKKELNRIADLFNKQNYQNTKKKLEKLRNDRARQMFPGKI